MRRTPRASASRLCGRACAVPVAIGMLLTTAAAGGSLAAADSDSVSSLVVAVAQANQALQDLGAEVQMQQEAVNKALVDVQSAHEAAEAAQQEVEASQRAVQDANTAIAAAQERFDAFAAATYTNGPSDSYLTASDPADILDTAAASQTLTVSSQQVMTDLKRARTEQVNRESQARLAKQNADRAAAAAQQSRDDAVKALEDAQHTFGDQQADLDRLTAERAAAQAKLDAARQAGDRPAAQARTTAAGSAAGSEAGSATPDDQWDRAPSPQGAAASGDAWDTPWDPTLPAIPSAFVSGDPIAIINTSLQIAATSAQVTADLGRKFLTSIGILKPADDGITNGQIPQVYGRQASEYVINRAKSQIGVPYSWGGGNAAGPSTGIDSGANTVGFDCSGLVLYAFAGVGIKLPHYSGAQYEKGRKIPSAEMRRGDVIFYGPGGSQHVAIYLGDDKMLEAPYTGSHVKISPVRTSGMTPHVIRYIEY